MKYWFDTPPSGQRLVLPPGGGKLHQYWKSANW